MKRCYDESIANAKPVMDIDFSTPRGHTDLVPVEMTEPVMLSPALSSGSTPRGGVEKSVWQ